MLTRLYIDNFLSFVNFEYRPEKKQLLLGVNGSGKSSLLAAIRLLKQFVGGDENPFTRSTRTRWQDKPLQIIEVEAVLDGEVYGYRIEIKFSPETGQVAVNLESLRVSGKTAFEFASGEVRFFSPDGSASRPLPFATTRSTLHLAQLSNPQVNRFVDWLDTVHCFQIDAYPGTMQETEERWESSLDYELDNFAGWYSHAVQVNPEENLGFLLSLRATLDGFQAMKFAPEADAARTLRVEFLGPSRQKISYSFSELSEGQRQLIGLYAILHFVIAKGHTVFIDEPENYIALREIQPWLLAAEDAVDETGGKLILVSHQPETLNQWAREYGLRFFRENNGHVRTEKFKPDPDLRPAELIARGWE